MFLAQALHSTLMIIPPKIIENLFCKFVFCINCSAYKVVVVVLSSLIRKKLNPRYIIYVASCSFHRLKFNPNNVTNNKVSTSNDVKTSTKKL